MAFHLLRAILWLRIVPNSQKHYPTSLARHQKCRKLMPCFGSCFGEPFQASSSLIHEFSIPTVSKRPQKWVPKMTLAITFEKLFGRRRDVPAFLQVCPPEGHMHADSVHIMNFTSNSTLFDGKVGYSGCEKGTHSMEHKCASLSFPSLSSSRRQQLKKLNGVGGMTHRPRKLMRGKRQCSDD